MEPQVKLVRVPGEEGEFTFFDKDTFADEMVSLVQRKQTNITSAAAPLLHSGARSEGSDNTTAGQRSRVISLRHTCETEDEARPTTEEQTADTRARLQLHVDLFEEMTRSYHYLLLLQHRRFLSAMETMLRHAYYTACAHDEAVRKLAEDGRRCEAQCRQLVQQWAAKEEEMELLKQQVELSDEKENVLLEHVQLLEEQLRSAARDQEALQNALHREEEQRICLVQQSKAREEAAIQQCEQEKAYLLGEATLLRRELVERVRQDAQRELTVAVQAQELREAKQLLLLLHDLCHVKAAAEAAEEDVHALSLFRNVNVDHGADFMFLTNPTSPNISKMGHGKNVISQSGGSRRPSEDSKKLVEELLHHLRQNTVDLGCMERCGEAMEEYLFRHAAERREMIGRVADAQRTRKAATTTTTGSGTRCETRTWGETEGQLVSKQFIQVMERVLAQLLEFKLRMRQKADIIQQKAEEDKQSGGKSMRKSILCDFSGRTYHQMTYQTCFQPLEKQLDRIVQHVQHVLSGEIESEGRPRQDGSAREGQRRNGPK